MAHGNRIVFSETKELDNIIGKIITKSTTIDHIFDVRTGLQAYEQGKGNPPQSFADVNKHIFDRDEWENEYSHCYLQGKDVCRYHVNWSKKWLQYGPWLSQPRELEIFTRPRVLLREITSEPPYCLKSVYISEPFLNNKSILNILHPEDKIDELKCLLGILNSKLISLYYKQRAVKSARKIFPKVVIKNLREFPYPIINSSIKSKRLVQLVDCILDFNKQSPSAKTAHEKTVLQRQIDATDRQIDQLVYQLYGLTEEEIRIVEGSV